MLDLFGLTMEGQRQRQVLVGGKPTGAAPDGAQLQQQQSAVQGPPTGPALFAPRLQAPLTGSALFAAAPPMLGWGAKVPDVSKGGLHLPAAPTLTVSVGSKLPVQLPPPTAPLNTLPLTQTARQERSKAPFTSEPMRRKSASDPPSGDKEQPIDGFVYTIRPFIAGGGHIKSVMWSPSGRAITDQPPGPARKPPRRGIIPSVPPGP